MRSRPPVNGGVRIAAGDLNGDGKAEIIAAQGTSAAASVIRIFDGLTGNASYEFAPYATSLGVYVAAGDVNGDGRIDLITGAGAGAGPHVRIFDGLTLLQTPPGESPRMLGEFYAYHPSFPGGVRVGAGDLNGDAVAEILTGAGPGGGPHVRAYAASGTEVFGIYGLNAAFAGGVYLEADGAQQARQTIQIIDNGVSEPRLQFSRSWAYSTSSGYLKDLHYSTATSAVAE